jgi:hypothetical protein
MFLHVEVAPFWQRLQQYTGGTAAKCMRTCNQAPFEQHEQLVNVANCMLALDDKESILIVRDYRGRCR